MYITVSDALKLPSFHNAQVIAGSGGLDRKIYRVSVAECPEFPIDHETVGTSNLLFANGDFFISSMYAIKDEPELLLETIKLYHQFNSSGLVIVLRYFKEIPHNVIQYANEANYPLIALGKNIAYADVITDVMKAIFSQQNNSTAVMLIDQILMNHYDDDTLIRLAFTLNPAFKSHIACFYIHCHNEITAKNNILAGTINAKNHVFALNYHDTILGFYTSEQKIRGAQIDALKSDIIQIITKYATDYHIGISDMHEGLQHIRLSMEEAIIACEAGRVKNEPTALYGQIGTYKLLLQINNRDVLKKFYQETIAPLQKYDYERKGELLRTLVSYVKNQGDIKKTAEELYQHVNTVRYRLHRICKLWNKEKDSLEFYENLSIAYKIHQITTSEELSRGQETRVLSAIPTGKRQADN